ncbi:uroporphyrinogen-III synthase [Paracoccus sp. 11-3]|uniref:Uroporphyrinogen-III synthase n=1 Tax=Paracoccus amoyensis TaxID=2760093 RepID=A0A926G7L4_9RHOB|nr:uroporphyrinogen-III synthase [Paracoccus amoyensis]MBC9247318.1 uroporphyrinogen-III synthase [Paracoccus amoyensis]
MATVARPTLLLTRPYADSQRFAAMLPEWRAIISPILEIVPVAHDVDVVRSAQGLVFTSGHAIASAGAGRGRLAICVGPRTGQLARRAGFKVVEGNGFAESLLPLIAAAEIPLLHPHGRHLARELPVKNVVVYDQLPLALTGAARDLLAVTDPVVVPLFSPRSARILGQQVSHAQAPLWPVAISRAAMDAWNAPAVARNIASEPSSRAMAAAIRQLPVREH